MIKKNSRPVRTATQSLLTESNITHQSLISFRLLRSIHKMVHRKGFVILSTHHFYDPQLEEYDNGRYQTLVDTIYVGKRKCKDACLRRRLRENVNGSMSVVV